MVFESTKIIAKMLEQKEIRYDIVEQERSSAVYANFRVKNCNNLCVHFISANDKNDVAVRILSYITIPEEKRPEILEIINSLHMRYRFIRFVLTKNNQIIVEYDIPVSCVALADVAYEMCVRFLDVADQGYVDFMKAIW